MREPLKQKDCGWVEFDFPWYAVGHDIQISPIKKDTYINLQAICGWELYGTRVWY